MISTRLYAIYTQASGVLAVAARPRGGEWLDDEISAWKAEGFDVVVSLLETEEQVELGLLEEAAVAHRHGIHFISFPIPDRDLPHSLTETSLLIDRLKDLLQQNRSVVIHCRQGVGRAGMIAAGVLVSMNVDPHHALETVSKARGVQVPETNAQREFVTLLRTSTSIR